MKNFNNNIVRDYIQQSSNETKIYLGCDSQRKKIRGTWWAVYTVALVVHIDGAHGCKIFYVTTKERDYDKKLAKPAMRLMNETYKAAEAYAQIAEYIGDRYFEIHLDINPSETHGSNCVAKQAIGYIRGTCNVIPFIKPAAFAASKAADHGARYKYDHQEQTA